MICPILGRKNQNFPKTLLLCHEIEELLELRDHVPFFWRSRAVVYFCRKNVHLHHFPVQAGVRDQTLFLQLLLTLYKSPNLLNRRPISMTFINFYALHCKRLLDGGLGTLASLGGQCWSDGSFLKLDLIALGSWRLVLLSQCCGGIALF